MSAKVIVLSEPRVRPKLVTASPSLSASSYSFLQQFIYAGSGIVVDEEKQYLLESRLTPLLRDRGMASLDDLSRTLATKRDAELSRSVIDAMTTNETLFFRDIAMFDSLKVDILPSLFEKTNGKRKLRIWSAAASTGQEAYSVAMMLLELKKSTSDVEIIGTDLSFQALERARLAKYLQFEVGRGLPAVYLLKYFERVGLEWQIKEEVRQMVSFRPLDLRQSLRTLGMFDLILCRNVLIYFDIATKRQILDQIRSQMNQEAYLVLGCAETTLNVHPAFHRRALGNSTFYTI